MAHTAITIRRAEQILGYGFETGTGTRTYQVIDGVIYTDLFTGDPVLPFTYTKAFNGITGRTTYFNEIIPTSTCEKTVDVTASWGSNEFTAEIDPFLVLLDDNPPTDSLSNAGTKSIKTEDYSETFATGKEQIDNLNVILHEGYGWYIRRPLIVSFGNNQSATHIF